MLSKCTHALEPERVGKVVERQQRTDAELLQEQQLVSIMRKRRLVKNARLGLEPRPFDAQPVVADAHVVHELRVFFIALVMHVRDGRIRSVPDMALPKPVVPAVVFVAALDLSRSRSDAQLKVVRESQRHGSASLNELLYYTIIASSRTAFPGMNAQNRLVRYQPYEVYSLKSKIVSAAPDSPNIFWPFSTACSI